MRAANRPNGREEGSTTDASSRPPHCGRAGRGTRHPRTRRTAAGVDATARGDAARAAQGRGQAARRRRRRAGRTPGVRGLLRPREQADIRGGRLAHPRTGGVVDSSPEGRPGLAGRGARSPGRRHPCRRALAGGDPAPWRRSRLRGLRERPGRPLRHPLGRTAPAAAVRRLHPRAARGQLLRAPDRQPGGDRRRRRGSSARGPRRWAAAGPGGVGQLRRRCRRAAAAGPQADRDRAAGGPELHVDGHQLALAEVAAPRRLHPARRTRPAHRRLRRRRPRRARSCTAPRLPRWSCRTATRADAVWRKNAFDVGEYGFGALANSLELGCDCLGEIHYFDAASVDDRRRAVHDQERHLHARGGRRRPLAAHRRRTGNHRGAPLAPPGRLALSPRSATTTTASTGTSTRTARSSSRSS